ncbi:MAG: Asp23/Gls24 family envelope stress response protein, partial [Staphylococcus epidermidis]|nr:Asp23/Gls24 family envelope stress response protein [Staphylococcus epidermidis]
MVNVADYSQSNLGKIEIAPEVLSVIASIATSEVEGITGHFAELKKTNLEKISRKNLNRDLKIHSAIKNVISTKTAHHINIEMQGILLSMYIAPVLDEDTINGVLLFLVDESDKIKAEKRRREFS